MAAVGHNIAALVLLAGFCTAAFALGSDGVLAAITVGGVVTAFGILIFAATTGRRP
jgi:hypothetical protein